jgi:hypothetical protein
MAQKRLPNIPLTITWTTLIGALDGILRFLGQPLATHELMGRTGFAFRLALTEHDGVLAAAPAAASIDLAAALPLLESAGRTLSLIEASSDSPRFAAVREQALAAIRRSIGHGRPAIAFDLHLPEFGIVHGYDDRAHTLFAGTLLSSQFGMALPESRWPVPERGGRLIVLIPGGRRRVVPVRAHSAALRFATRYAECGDPGDPTGATHGLAAYARWRAAFAGAEPIDAAGNARTIQTVQAARRDAAHFLREMAAAQPEVAPTLIRAATAYDAVALAFSRMATLFPYPSGGDTSGQAGRHVAVSALQVAEAQERAALDLIRESLGRMPDGGEQAHQRPLLGRLFGGRAERR